MVKQEDQFKKVISHAKEYGYIFGGVFIWEYYDQPKNWLKKMNKIINNEYLPVYMKMKCNIF